MTIITQNGLMTATTPWWFAMRISDNKKQLILETTQGDKGTSLIIAKYKTQKQIIDLYESINFALHSGEKCFNVNKWEADYLS